MKNIDILMELRKQLNAANFIMDDIEVEIETGDVELDELISEEDELIYELFETINDINQLLNMFTVDLRQAMTDEIKANTENKNFECETYATWCEMISIEPTKQYIAEELGGMLYEMAERKLKPDIILRELNRYIPETRNNKESVKQLFRKYFYSVVQYKERAPGIYPKFDSHMKQVYQFKLVYMMIRYMFGMMVNSLKLFLLIQFMKSTHLSHIIRKSLMYYSNQV